MRLAANIHEVAPVRDVYRVHMAIDFNTLHEFFFALWNRGHLRGQSSVPASKIAESCLLLLISKTDIFFIRCRFLTVLRLKIVRHIVQICLSELLVVND